LAKFSVAKIRPKKKNR